MGVLKEFKSFVLRGNVMDLAVAVVVGTAFNAVVQSAVKDLITPLVGLFGNFNFSALSYHHGKTVFALGIFINSFVNFVVIASVVFLLIVKPLNKVSARQLARRGNNTPIDKPCPYCISTIPWAATRCPNCTSVLDAQSGQSSSISLG